MMIIYTWLAKNKEISVLSLPLSFGDSYDVTSVRLVY